MTYVIGDVHGCFDEMMKLLNVIEERDDNAKIIFVGDFVDRGPKVLKTLEWAMENISENGKYRAVCGNHEDLIIEWYEEWIRWHNGDIAMRKRYKREPKTDYDFFYKCRVAGILDKEKLEPIISWIKKLPINISLNINGIDYVVAHAWKQHDRESRFSALWERRRSGNVDGNEIIVHGHTPTIGELYMDKDGHIPGMISYKEKEINIDGGCVFWKSTKKLPCMLCAICLDTLEEIYPWTIEERFAMMSNKDKNDPFIVRKSKKYRERYIRPIKYREDMLRQLVIW